MTDPSSASTTSPTEGDGSERRSGYGSLGTALGVLVVAWGVGIAGFPIQDNSFFTHLATGRLILDTGSVPTVDPYTFTALGTDWTVQSWLASVIYATAERLGGAEGLRVLALLVYGGGAGLLWRLSRPASSIVGRIVVIVPALVVVTEAWSIRPYMAGVIGLALVWLSLDGSGSPWLLTPLLWVWANTHGSYPLGGALVVTVLAGTMIDHRRESGEWPAVRRLREFAVLKAVVAGVVLAAVGPLRWEVWLFPVKALERSDVLSNIVEWRAPEFASTSQRVFLLFALATIAALVRSGRWRQALPVLAFVGAAVFSQRNIVMAVPVLLPVLATAVPPVGTLRSTTRPALGPAVTTVFTTLVVVIAVTVVSSELTEFDPYPAHPVAWLGTVDAAGEAGNVATQDFTGNFLEVLDGAEGEVFVDDRADMFPPEVFEDVVALGAGHPRWEEILSTYDIEVVVWERDSPLGSLLASDGDWRTVFTDTEFSVACRRGTGCRPLVH
ncbi:MAG: hypothetical protein U5K30_00680 [Acidimicrobiales bacterium]|nr:hypothetical protein [Acidimicrobiales bacterium]